MVSRSRYNFENCRILLIDPAAHGLELLLHIFTGFGAKALLRAASAEEAQNVIRKSDVDLIVCEVQLATPTDGYDFVKWLRHSKIEPNNSAPVIVVCGHTPKSLVEKGRDCGANFIVAKPLTPQVMIDRIAWIARENRFFVECQAYLGPSRRFHSIGPPTNSDGRRSTGLAFELGEAVEPNLSQDDIDALLKPQRAKG